jgi:hypothetical protein
MKQLFTIFLLLSTLVNAEDIYIGDKINLKVKNSPENEIREALKDWEIIGIKNQGNSKIVTFQTFETGEKKINIGGNEILINIKTSLTPEETEKKDQEIFLNLSDGSNKILERIPFPYISFISGIGGVLALALLIKEVFRRKKKIITPEEKFMKEINSLEDKNWNFGISQLLREYIDIVYPLNFSQGIYKTYGVITLEDIDFLKDLDTIKFSEGKAGEEKNKDKTYSKEKALDFFDRLKKIREDGKNV